MLYISINNQTFQNYQRHLTSRPAPNEEPVTEAEKDAMQLDQMGEQEPPQPLPTRRGRKRKNQEYDEQVLFLLFLKLSYY